MGGFGLVAQSFQGRGVVESGGNVIGVQGQGLL